jgi:uncharacterized protein (DUF427 family)
MPEPHQLVFEEDRHKVRVIVDGETIVETADARILREGSLPPVHYVPLEHVNGEFLEQTDHTTTCPFKGEASYWSIVVGDRRVKNAMWAYEDPIENASYLKGYGAFYVNLVDDYLID